MKILIEHYKCKRELEGSGFNICGSREALLNIANTILEKASPSNFVYGWVNVRDEEQDEHSKSATEPMKWRD